MVSLPHRDIFGVPYQPLRFETLIICYAALIKEVYKTVLDLVSYTANVLVYIATQDEQPRYDDRVLYSIPAVSSAKAKPSDQMLSIYTLPRGPVFPGRDDQQSPPRVSSDWFRLCLILFYSIM